MPVTFYPKLHLRFDNLYAKYEDFKLKWLSLLGIAPSWMIGCLAKKPFCFCGCSKAFPCLEEGQHWINQFFWYRKVCEDDDPSCQGLDLIVWHSFFFIGLPHKKRYEITTHKILGSRRIFSCKLNFWLCFFWLYFFLWGEPLVLTVHLPLHFLGVEEMDKKWNISSSFTLGLSAQK